MKIGFAKTLSCRSYTAAAKEASKILPLIPLASGFGEQLAKALPSVWKIRADENRETGVGCSAPPFRFQPVLL